MFSAAERSNSAAVFPPPLLNFPAIQPEIKAVTEPEDEKPEP
jgi:hypothetical protein